ncbi:MAG: SDR family NAD(P)-dependent oxidoreductase [Gammaproteobacteria bacterium]|nr:SDR family NAD(P)-dependent oxidoreductase [Gammaproteobacteria bacterium]
MIAEKNRLAWITGGGSGIGKALAIALTRLGWHVIISGRTTSKLKLLSDEHQSIDYLTLDVTDKAANVTVFDTILNQWGCPSLVILNAGDYTPMPAQEFDLDLIYKLNSVNYLGVINGLASALPAMKAAHKGQILMMSSVAGYRGLPDAAPYGATKAALINFAESLHIPLKKEGVLLRVVNPGFVSTQLTDQNDFKMPAQISAEKAAEEIINALDNDSFEITFPKRFTYSVKLLRCLPYRWYFYIVSKITGK